MSQWKINPQGVQTILTTVDTDRGELEQALAEKKFTDIFDGLTWGGGITVEVPTSVNNLLEAQGTNLANISNRVNAGLVGVSNAVIAYNNGQEDQALVFQTEMLSSAESGDFVYFVENGHS